VPDEQDDERADNGADEARALIGPVPADRLTDEGGDESAGNAEQRRGIKPAGLFCPGASRRATMPAIKPMTITQRKCIASLAKILTGMSSAR
jgi:hypothetical protein